MTKFIKVIAFISLLPMLSGCSGFNKIEQNDEGVRKAWSNVETSYQRRLDLIENLVQTVKGAADFEKETFIGVAEARSGVKKAQENLVQPSADMLGDKAKLAEFYASQKALMSQGQALFNIAIERYPELKATDLFRDFMAQLEGTENRIKKARDDYNKAVETHNVYIRQVPGRFINWINGSEQHEYFDADPGAENAPKVDFSN